MALQLGAKKLRTKSNVDILFFFFSAYVILFVSPTIVHKVALTMFLEFQSRCILQLRGVDIVVYVILFASPTIIHKGSIDPLSGIQSKYMLQLRGVDIDENAFSIAVFWVFIEHCSLFWGSQVIVSFKTNLHLRSILLMFSIYYNYRAAI